MEGTLLDVLSLDGLVPLVVEATERGGELTKVVGKSVELSHLLQVGVASVIGSCEFKNVEEFTHDLEHVVENAALQVLLENALSWVLDAPGFNVILDSLEVANLDVLVENVNQFRSNILDLIGSDRPEVIVHFGVKVVSFVEWCLSPGTEALIRDNMVVLVVESLDEALVGVLEEQSLRLNVVQLWSIRLWAMSSHLVHHILNWAGLN